MLESIVRCASRTRLDKLPPDKYSSLCLKELLEHFESQSGLHDYAGFYEQHLSPLKEKNTAINILEIGTLRGGGLASWFFYFPKANFIGMDFNPFKIRYKSKRIRNMYADVSSKKILANTSKQLNQTFDLIIEDCSHMLIDQILCFFALFKHVKPGGYYVVEDLNFPYIGTSHNPTHEKIGLRDILTCIDSGQPVHSKHVSQQTLREVASQIDSMHFHQSKNPNGYKIFGECDVSEIVFVKKKNCT